MDPALHDALTDLHAYVLLLEGERVRLDQRLSRAPELEGAEEHALLARRRAELDEELEALRGAVTALRDQFGARPVRAGPPAPRPGSGSPPAA